MKILVTGCAGFLGFHICEELLLKNKNISIVGIDNINSYYSKKIKYKRINILKNEKNLYLIKLTLRMKKN